VPLDDTKPNGPTISLALARLRAKGPGSRIGSLLVNPGGPGASGVQFVEQSASTLPAAIRARFDIVGWDPRGVGGSAPVTCTSNLDSYYDLNFAPQTDAERQALDAGVQALVSECQAKNAADLPYLSSARTAGDMDRIRAALGDPKLSYVGFSYGTYLGSLYADRFPTHVRAMVLDGAVDPALPAAAQQIQQAVGFEQDLDMFLQSCSTDTTCAFRSGGNASGAYDQLRARLDDATIPAGGGHGRTLDGTEFDIGVTQFLYAGKTAWPALAQALESAAHGDGAAMLMSSDEYTGRSSDGTYDQSLEAFLAIGCLDGPDVGGIPGLQAIEVQAKQAAPRLGASVVNNSLACALWPVPVQPAPVPHAAGAPPIVVIGNTNDPATPYEWAQGLSRELSSAVLLTVNSDMHTAYASGSTCVDAAVNRYLLTVVPPAPGTRC
ncbi:MAG TPA: alpha/beta hydrolase, partial [Acidimicrobiia bacterium]|nr:alpha/beta hydrolase [Acidimicrobiia bacterium]